MKSASVGLRYLLQELSRIPNTKKILCGESNGSDRVWVIVDDASVQQLLRYSQIFVDAIEKDPDFWCDFMVYDEKEFKELLPREKLSVKSLGVESSMAKSS